MTTVVISAPRSVPNAVDEAIKLANRFGFGRPPTSHSAPELPTGDQKEPNHPIVLHCWKCGG